MLAQLGSRFHVFRRPVFILPAAFVSCRKQVLRKLKSELQLFDAVPSGALAMQCGLSYALTALSCHLVT